MIGMPRTIRARSFPIYRAGAIASHDRHAVLVMYRGANSWIDTLSRRLVATPSCYALPHGKRLEARTWQRNSALCRGF
jgi:hypothetical protein